MNNEIVYREEVNDVSVVGLVNKYRGVVIIRIEGAQSFNLDMCFEKEVNCKGRTIDDIIEDLINCSKLIQYISEYLLSDAIAKTIFKLIFEVFGTENHPTLDYLQSLIKAKQIMLGTVPTEKVIRVVRAQQLKEKMANINNAEMKLISSGIHNLSSYVNGTVDIPEEDLVKICSILRVDTAEIKNISDHKNTLQRYLKRRVNTLIDDTKRNILGKGNVNLLFYRGLYDSYITALGKINTLELVNLVKEIAKAVSEEEHKLLHTNHLEMLDYIKGKYEALNRVKGIVDGLSDE